jgi:LPXTG-motif cell wall-anchored protein
MKGAFMFQSILPKIKIFAQKLPKTGAKYLIMYLIFAITIIALNAGIKSTKRTYNKVMHKIEVIWHNLTKEPETKLQDQRIKPRTKKEISGTA